MPPKADLYGMFNVPKWGGGGGLPPIDHGDGDPHPKRMPEERIARLETHFEYVRKDLDEIKTTLATMATTIATLPTKRDLTSWTWQMAAVSVAAIALIVGGIIGGLAWIKPDAPQASAAPTINVPAAPPPNIIINIPPYGQPAPPQQ